MDEPAEFDPAWLTREFDARLADRGQPVPDWERAEVWKECCVDAGIGDDQ